MSKNVGAGDKMPTTIAGALLYLLFMLMAPPAVGVLIFKDLIQEDFKPGPIKCFVAVVLLVFTIATVASLVGFVLGVVAWWLALSALVVYVAIGVGFGRLGMF
jgi:RsiW-degrading membrane proteinase PrsW (M82 family)